MAQFSTLRGFVRDELGELTAGRWSDTQINSWLNRGVDYCIGELHRGKCYSLLRENIKYVEYTLDILFDEYTMWDVINNETTSKGEVNTNSWYGYIHGMIGDYVLHKATLQEYHRLNATTGEYAPTTYEPWIVFSGYDRTVKYLTYTTGTMALEQDGVLIGATSAAKARVAIDIPPKSGTRAGSNAAGYFYVYGDSGTFTAAGENLDYRAPKGSSTITTVAVLPALSPQLTAESHDNCPTFIIRPIPTTATTLKVWFINKPTVMSAAADTPSIPYDCDELLILYATARAWKADRNFDMHAAFWAEFNQELQKKIQDYQEVTFNPVPFIPR